MVDHSTSTALGIDWDNIPMLQAVELMNTADPTEVDEVLARWQAHFRGVYREIDASVLTMLPDAFTIGQLGWTLPIWGPMWFARYIAPYASEENLDAFFVKEYSRGWNARQRLLFRELESLTLLSPWQRIIRECITAYNRKQYHLVIPALLAITEGVIAAATGVSTIKNSTRLQPPIRAQVNASEAALIAVGWQSILGFIVTTFRNAPFDDIPPSRLNRHWVLHGRHVPAASKTDCLRLFQAIHTSAVLWQHRIDHPQK